MRLRDVVLGLSLIGVGAGAGADEFYDNANSNVEHVRLVVDPNGAQNAYERDVVAYAEAGLELENIRLELGQRRHALAVRYAEGVRTDNALAFKKQNVLEAQAEVKSRRGVVNRNKPLEIAGYNVELEECLTAVKEYNAEWSKFEAEADRYDKDVEKLMADEQALAVRVAEWRRGGEDLKLRLVWLQQLEQNALERASQK